MIGQFRVLQKVKRLREDKALRALEKARAAVREAEARRDALAAELAESTRTLPVRERGVYAPLFRQSVAQVRLEDAQQEALALREAHHRLADRHDRARDAVERARQKLEAARRELRLRQQEVEKIDTVTDDMVLTLADEATAREEIEIEDAFSRPRGLAAQLGPAA